MNKISINNSNKASEVRNSDNKPLKTESSKKAGESKEPARFSPDRVRFSGRAAEVQKLAERVAKLPDIRSELVSRFQNAISVKAFQPASLDIATAIIGEEI